MEEAEEKIQKAVEEAMTRVKRRKENPRTELQYTAIRNSEELPDSDVDIDVVEDLVGIKSPERHFEQNDTESENMYMGGQEVDETGEGNGIGIEDEERDATEMENMASNFSGFSNIYLIVLSKMPLPKRYSTPINDRPGYQFKATEDEDVSMDEDMNEGMSMDEVVTGGKKRGTNVSSFSVFEHFSSVSSKDSATEEIFCT